MFVRIYQKTKSAMQSGKSQEGEWVIAPILQQSSQPQALMGWSGGGSTSQQLELSFSSLDNAIHFAVDNGYGYEIMPSQNRKIKPKAYADNFKYDRLQPWTH